MDAVVRTYRRLCINFPDVGIRNFQTVTASILDLEKIEDPSDLKKGIKSLEINLELINKIQTVVTAKVDILSSDTLCNQEFDALTRKLFDEVSNLIHSSSGSKELDLRLKSITSVLAYFEESLMSANDGDEFRKNIQTTFDLLESADDLSVLKEKFMEAPEIAGASPLAHGFGLDGFRGKGSYTLNS